MKNESVKKSLGKSKNVLEEKRKTVMRKICIKKTNTFTIIAMNFAQEQLKRISIHSRCELQRWYLKECLENGDQFVFGQIWSQCLLQFCELLRHHVSYSPGLILERHFNTYTPQHAQNSSEENSKIVLSGICAKINLMSLQP